MPEQEWRPCVGFPSYEVSRDGLVRRVARAQGTWPGRMLKAKVIAGLAHVVLRQKPFVTTVGVHNLVHAAFVGPVPRGMIVRHANGNRTDNRIENLRLVPAAEVRWATRLNPESVRTIRQRRREGLTLDRLADMFHVCRTTVRKVVYGRTWACVA